MSIGWLLFLQFLNMNLIPLHTKKIYSVTTLINAKWYQTPCYLEIAEYLAEESPSMYWEFLDRLGKLETSLADAGTELQTYLKAIELSREILSERKIPLLKLAISMHSLTPKIQTHIQLSLEVLANIEIKCEQSIFALVSDEVVCSLEDLRAKLLNGVMLDSAQKYEFDHIFPGSENNTQTVILYGDIGSSIFTAYHRFLKNEATKGIIKYVSRHYIKKLPERKVRLSGYGVELHLKSTEYKSQDDAPHPDCTSKFGETFIAPVDGFDFLLLQNKYPILVTSLNRLRSNLSQKEEELTPLKPWELQELGIKASQKIALVQGEESLQMLQHTVQNFPAQAKSLILQKVSADFKNEMKNNAEIFAKSLHIQPPDAALFVNGQFFDVETLDLSVLLENLRKDLETLDDLQKNGFKGKVASSLLSLHFSETLHKEYAIDIRDSAIIWINNIEIDVQYKRWSSSVMEFLTPSFPGMLRNVRRNIFHLVLLVDPISLEAQDLVKLCESFVIHLAPLRFGLVFDTRNDNPQTLNTYIAMNCAFNYVKEKMDSRAALSFITDVYASVKSESDLTIKDIKLQLMKTFQVLTFKEIDIILGTGSDYDYGRKQSNDFVERVNFQKSPIVLLNGIPLPQNLLNKDDFEEAVFSAIMQQTTILQKTIYRGELNDNEILIDHLMNKPYVMPRLNQRILSSTKSQYLDLSGTSHDIKKFDELINLNDRDMTATLLQHMKYFKSINYSASMFEDNIEYNTIWIVADLNTEIGKEILINSLKFMKYTNNVRVAFIPNVEEQNLLEDKNLNYLIWAVAQSLEAVEATSFALKVLSCYSYNYTDIPNAVTQAMIAAKLQIKVLSLYCRRVLNLKMSKRAVFFNGKVFGPLNDNEKFTVDDFNLVLQCNLKNYIEKISSVLKTSDEDLKLTSDKLLKLYTTLVPRHSKDRIKIPPEAKETVSVVKLEPQQNQESYINVVAIMDPSSRVSQKLTAYLTLLRKIINCKMRVYFCAVEQHSDMPIKNFYRFVVEPEIRFHHDGRMVSGPIANFLNLPTTSLFTQNLQVPENWLVEPVRSVYDLDNIKLYDIGGPVHSEFELEYLLLEGHCFESTTGAPPRGLQITLGSPQNSISMDTIVMANLGYFQLKVNPGIWNLKIRQGRSSSIYEIVSAEGPQTFSENNRSTVVVNSLRSHFIKLKVGKKKGREDADLLGDVDDDDRSRGIWSSITTSFGGKSDKSELEVVNIFSVASGHLYERLLRIMMLSLLKHTQSPIKFWFLKNYLSPQFTDLLPHMAKAYGFQFELVQYKWPRWLHQQTEKQRIIWGYKILFLDVLFPLDVKKIIFVDADAVVRANIQELNDLDLNGAPYAYTPFCDSRKEMEGFRFWKQGYWRNHLMGRKYHISAIYVVDLKRFRKIAAGDRLRGQYQALSQDANSLSNLDQDLPNNMIHQVAIKSLPEDWLWCHTWCSDESFLNAKIIDLCNNPLTKEAKLTAAERIVPEWKEYDKEIKTLASNIDDQEVEIKVNSKSDMYSKKTIHSEL